MLTERRASLLRFIVDEYVDSVQPVGSQTVVRKYRLPVSPATIRNEMMRLEEEGYISQPHTSAGRVPSDKGYRYYVESLMAEEEPPEEIKRMIRHQFHQVARELEHWARLAAGILAAQVRNVAVVTAPRSPQARLRWLELVSMHDFLVLLIVVLREARVRQQILSLSHRLDQEELTALAQKLNSLLGGLTVDQIQRQSQGMSAVEREVAEGVAGLLEAEDAARYGPAALEGLRDILSQPEFLETDRILDLLDVFDERNLPRVIPLASVPEGAVQVIIGSENPEDALRECSVVVSRYGGPAGVRGTLGVVGPTRLRYSSAVAIVRYMASLMDELMATYFG